MKWSVNSIDIKAAFLQSESIGRDVFLIPPAEAKCDKDVLWKLEKCVYGLNDAARNWYFTLAFIDSTLRSNYQYWDPTEYIRLVSPHQI